MCVYWSSEGHSASSSVCVLVCVCVHQTFLSLWQGGNTDLSVVIKLAPLLLLFQHSKVCSTTHAHAHRYLTVHSTPTKPRATNVQYSITLKKTQKKQEPPNNDDVFSLNISYNVCWRIIIRHLSKCNVMQVIKSKQLRVWRSSTFRRECLGLQADRDRHLNIRLCLVFCKGFPQQNILTFAACTMFEVVTQKHIYTEWKCKLINPIATSTPFPAVWLNLTWFDWTGLVCNGHADLF